MKATFTTLCLFAFMGAAQAAPKIHAAFTGPDLSGVYTCQGDDAAEGQYTGTVTLILVPQQSVGSNGAYTFKLEVPGFGSYPGHAASQGATAAIYFANTDPSTQDFGTGIATFEKNMQGKWTFNKYYHQPAYKGGNHGFERCAQK